MNWWRRLRARKLDAKAGSAYEAGDYAATLQALLLANRLVPDAWREVMIRDVRLLAAGRDLGRPGSNSRFFRKPRLDTSGILPSCTVSQLCPELVRAAFNKAGCLYVPGVLDADEVAQLREVIDSTHADWERDREQRSWVAPARIAEPEGHNRLIGTRSLSRPLGAALAVDSPRAMFRCSEMLERHGLVDLARDFLGEVPMYSANKFVLWRVPADGPDASWHQDGRFLEDSNDIRSLNVWTALTDCGEGEDAPGMELVLERLDYYVMPDESCDFDWTVSDKQVDSFRERVPVVTPRFRAGDMLLFDHRLLHRTARLQGMTQQRYAIETWMFPLSAFPGGRLAMTA